VTRHPVTADSAQQKLMERKWPAAGLLRTPPCAPDLVNDRPIIFPGAARRDPTEARARRLKCTVMDVTGMKR